MKLNVLVEGVDSQDLAEVKVLEKSVEMRNEALKKERNRMLESPGAAKKLKLAKQKQQADEASRCIQHQIDARL